MTDYYQRSEHVPTDGWCPGCTEHPPTHANVHTQWCAMHQPSTAGADDALTGERPLMGTENEAEGAACRAMADLLRRKRVLRP